MIVMKFGGTSVGSADAFAQVAKIVAQKVAEQNAPQAATERPGVIVVTSAMAGVTNMLIEAAQKARAATRAFTRCSKTACCSSTRSWPAA